MFRRVVLLLFIIISLFAPKGDLKSNKMAKVSNGLPTYSTVSSKSISIK